jgi:Bacillus/Clostridium GerA spore germination protein
MGFFSFFKKRKKKQEYQSQQDNQNQEKEQSHTDNQAQEKEQSQQDNQNQEKEQSHTDNQGQAKEQSQQDNQGQEKEQSQQDSQGQKKEQSQQDNQNQEKEQSQQDNQNQEKEQSHTDNQAQEKEQSQQKSQNQQVQAHSIPKLIKQLQQSNDFVHYHTSEREGEPFWLSYFRSTIEGTKLNKNIMPYLQEKSIQSLEELKEEISVSSLVLTEDVKEAEKLLFQGNVLIQMKEEDTQCLLVDAAVEPYRKPSRPEIEFGVVASQESFVEGIDTNINLVRRRLPIPELRVKETIVGALSKTKVAIIYIENIANEENINTITQRIDNIKFEQIIDSSTLSQLIEDNVNAVVPLYINTERPDRVVLALGEGRIAVLVDGSPYSIITPSRFIDFFTATEDYNLPWVSATCFRLLRFFAVLFSLFATATYVAVMNFHYELIPIDLLNTLISSRIGVPLPPILEAITLELAIDLLREAGARLPIKVGQTLGIVGGIVIGQASVEAGLTSNVLLIIVAVSALASFITPIYKMGNSIRWLRFPFIIFAEIWGLIGISICFLFLITHMFRLKSLGRPYGLYPLRNEDIKDSWIRGPLSALKNRPSQTSTKESLKHQKKVKQKTVITDFDD